MLNCQLYDQLAGVVAANCLGMERRRGRLEVDSNAVLVLVYNALDVV